MILLDGKTLANQILSSLKFADTRLDIILVGNDPASLKYTQLKQRRATEIGVNCQLHHLSENTPTAEVIKLIDELNRNPDVTGLMVQLPLPPSLNKDLVLNSLDPTKDVDGLNPNSSFTPAAVVGIIKLLENYQINLDHQNVVIINDSDLIGQPLKKIFESKDAIVTLCNDRTVDLASITQSADILVSATG
ncbi:hypothetical protein A3K55_01135, partial [Candidatus Shapirobacteria bacterium RBG_13_44_7]